HELLHCLRLCAADSDRALTHKTASAASSSSSPAGSSSSSSSSSASLLSSPSSSSSDGGSVAATCAAVVRRLSAAVLRHHALFASPLTTRRRHSTLAAFVEWVWGECVGRVEDAARREAQHCFALLAAPSPAKWVEIRCERWGGVVEWDAVG